MGNFYEILGVSRLASTAEIKRAYRQLVLLYHPDKHGGDAAAEERFKQLTLAYSTLIDARRRAVYDAGVVQQACRGAASGRSASFGQQVGEVFHEVFAQFWGRRQRNAPPPPPGNKRTFHLSIALEQAYAGLERDITIDFWQRCATCSGTGAKPGSAPHLCHACGGSGELQAQRGFFTMAQKCGFCAGLGRTSMHPCAECAGRGVALRPRLVRVALPAGVADGAVLHIAGGGDVGLGGGARGDLEVVVQVAAHALFTRNGADVHCTLPIRVVDAILGGVVDVPTLDGSVRMRIPAGTQTGRVLRLRGKGMPRLVSPGSCTGGRGDQHVTLVVETPCQLSAVQIHLLQQWAAADDPEQYPRRQAFLRQAGLR